LIFEVALPIFLAVELFKWFDWWVLKREARLNKRIGERSG